MPNLQGGWACLNFARFFMQFCNPDDPKGGHGPMPPLNTPLITPGCDVAPKYAVFDAPAGSRGHPFDCSMITFHYPIATWFISTSEN